MIITIDRDPDMRDLIRTVRFAPYRRGAGPRFTLKLYDTGTSRDGKYRLAYTLTQHGDDETGKGRRKVELFNGEDFCASPLYAIDADETVAALMGFLTLREGDTDDEYFTNYTPAQIDYRDTHAEALYC